MIESINTDQNIVIRGSGTPNIDTLGRICISKKDFIYIGGFDESIEEYGAEDDDIIYRLKLLGRTIQYFNNIEYSKIIQHSDFERIQNEKIIKNIHSIYIEFVNFFKSNVMMFFNDFTYSSFTLIDKPGEEANEVKNGYMLSQSLVSNDFNAIEKKILVNNYNNLLFGNWIDKGATVILDFDNNKIVFHKKEQILSNGKNNFNQLLNQRDYLEMIFYYTSIKNRQRLKQNVLNKTIQVNNNKFGCGIVFYNFALTPIVIL